MSLAAREVLKKCENLMKLKKSHSTNVVTVDKAYDSNEAIGSNANRSSPDYLASIPTL
jgi:hypothetical protein